MAPRPADGVTTAIRSGRQPWPTNQRKRCNSAVVFPVPAAPRIRSEPWPWVTASRWAGSNSSSAMVTSDSIGREMTSTHSALDADWLGICRHAASGLSEMLAGVPTTEQRAVETGTRGSGGDRTLVIDRDAESLVFSQLQALSDQGQKF